MDTEKLIEAVKEYEVLYVSQEGYKNVKSNNKKWDEIGVSLQMTGEIAKRKWKGLRDSYAKHLRSLKTTSGQDTKSLNRYKAWPWAQQMAFLKPYLEYAQTDSIVGDIRNEGDISSDEVVSSPLIFMQENSDISPVEENGEESETSVILNSSKKNKKLKICSKTNFSSNTDKVISFLQNRAVEEDEIDLIFKSFAKTVKRFSPQRKAMVKAKLAKLITDEELAHLYETSELSTSPICY